MSNLSHMSSQDQSDLMDQLIEMTNNVNDSEGLKLKSQVHNILQTKENLKKEYE